MTAASIPSSSTASPQVTPTAAAPALPLTLTLSDFVAGLAQAEEHGAARANHHRARTETQDADTAATLDRLAHVLEQGHRADRVRKETPATLAQVADQVRARRRELGDVIRAATLASL
ncbi:hypothetical protein AMAG_12797 [Allomyces macrogynus ATCC 38327]|uniref:Uncharacterized protein n=1 Tax=Allomyces macrogynus (strain ATCC 38327) TaxID=578462 RepID=A0A0L0T1L8_ALLM3|nr:hypothetical protein AMAG_12797 [Allomyces macrogynus ATCC 38327]|eukprot:KNE68632.1 hypothetical protein AMAG_12797 [Allomyces macrogynus ATCC 38327]